jgi:hypothetical protein
LSGGFKIVRLLSDLKGDLLAVIIREFQRLARLELAAQTGQV